MGNCIKAKGLERRDFIGLAAGAALGAGALLSACSVSGSSPTASSAASASAGAVVLPSPDPDPESPFGVDKLINVDNLDPWLSAPGVVLRDMRMIDDSARFEDIGGDSKLSITVEGFTVVPWPYIGTLNELPVSGAYEGPHLFDIEWGEGMEILSSKPNYTQSDQIIEELFPKDAPLLIMCGGGGYTGMTISFLRHKGWDPNLLYNVGGAWNYTGDKVVQLISYADPNEPEYYLWRTNIVHLDFDLLKPL